MSNHAKGEYRVGVGASSILMVLVVLALTAISLLSFSTARNAEVLTKRNVVMTTAYYEAATRVQQKLAAMDTLMVEKRKEASAVDAESLREDLRNLGITDIQILQENENWAFLFFEEAGYERQIRVEGMLTLSGSTRYQVKQYQLVSGPALDDYDEFLLLGE